LLVLDGGMTRAGLSLLFFRKGEDDQLDAGSLAPSFRQDGKKRWDGRSGGAG